MSNKEQKDFNNCPADALFFRQPEVCNFNVQSADGKHAVTLTAFSGKEFSHWWWGRSIFDRSGVTIPTGKIPIDFNHNPDEALGYLDKFSGGQELIGSGYLIPFKEGDRASEIIFKKNAGVPYQCSVALGNSVFEYEFVKPRESAEVNGQTVFGGDDGIFIFRKFEVIGVAVCLYGSDTNTAVFNKGENVMPTKVDEKPNVDEKNAETALEAGRVLFKQYVKKFGNERGARYFADGLSEEQASGKYIEEVGKEVLEKDAKISEFAAKVSELEKAIEGLKSSAASDSGVQSEEFKRLQEENRQFKDAAKTAVGEQTPVSGGQGSEQQRKEFSPLPENLQPYNTKVQEHLDSLKQSK